MPEDEKPLPFKNMIYIDDGETDIPAMKMTKLQGGTSITVYNSRRRKIKRQDSLRDVCETLIKVDRTDYMEPADYSNDSDLVKIIKLSISNKRFPVILKMNHKFRRYKNVVSNNLPLFYTMQHR